MNIHPTAIIHPGAKLHPSVKVGAYTEIHEHVSIDEGTVIGSHCVIDGHTRIGKHNHFYRFCSIGGMPQDKKYANEPTRLEIGDHNTIREFVTISTGTIQDQGVTKLGDDNWIMAYVHIAHDCVIGSHTILANGVQLAGHVHIGDWAIIGGLSASHQFVNIGEHSMTGGMSAIRQNIAPYSLGAGQPYHPVGINSEGLKRRGFTAEQIALLRECFKIIFKRQLSTSEALIQVQALQQEHPEHKNIIEPYIQFLSHSERGIGR
ncbi:acyl-ACP--UDP-N-acetylglucosamine O-acyltransferase [Basilea psittacipulmonis]|uniref:Acyl-[acyl-carrier-protein]--UDP-N-acetylglucosamine O-acyltransferase n=1 Tax=Basilea psittacipulmonis DSM 24701 TaxID=1072685 RepID=A0A077DEQ3_9BURK|nr:acyl-ACP--UDP-N-acetylglucosamine O-acyltransferase [Basilea psittacipulmonis]AIL32641.1 UDP-N-acetylglucosamine acyltransferase [Basilea psittacipulmonis DSM 24701]